MITIQDIVKKLKNQDYTITYNDAIDLLAVYPNIEYHWEEFLDGRQVLVYVRLEDYNVKLLIKGRK